MLKCAVVVCAIATAGGASACGSGDASDGGSSSIVVETTDPSAQKVVVKAPKSVDAGVVRITLENHGDTLHDAQLFLVEDGHTGKDIVADLLEQADGVPKPSWMKTVGGVAAVAPGARATVTQVLEPGTYYIADTQERPTDGFRVVNAYKGGIAKLEVTGDGGGELPATPARITAGDRGFDTAGIGPGSNRVTFRNDGRESHQVVAFPLRKGASIDDGIEALPKKASEIGWVPVDVPASHATTVLDSGGEQVTELTLKPGRYALVCYMSDRKGGPPHYTEGMLSGLEVSSAKERPAAAAR